MSLLWFFQFIFLEKKISVKSNLPVYINIHFSSDDIHDTCNINITYLKRMQHEFNFIERKPFLGRMIFVSLFL